MKDQNHTKSIPALSQWESLMVDEHLPPQQARVAQTLLRGLGDKQIAKAMGISVPTVRTHMARLLARTGCRDRAGLILHMAGVFYGGCIRSRCRRFK